MKLVAGFDGSPESRDALRLAQGLAHVEGADLHVAVVLAQGPLPLESADERSERFDQLLADAESELPDSSWIAERISDSSPAAGLDSLARKLDAAMIVLGSTHRGKAGSVLLGSTGQHLLQGAPCPVAVAPRGYRSGDHFGLGLIGVAYDGEPESKLALAEAEQLARRLGAALSVIAVVPELAPTEAVAPELDELRQSVEDRYRGRLDEALAGLEGRVEAEPKLIKGDPAPALAGEGVELDLLVLGSRGFGPLRATLLGGVSGSVMRTAPCPVIVVPRGAEEEV